MDGLSGDGYGYGYGDGYGSGYGSGEKATDYWNAAIPHFPLVESARQRLQTLIASGALICYWRSNQAGKPCNGGSGQAVHAGLIQTLPGPLVICTKNALHGTLLPPAWKGDRIWLVALIGEVVSQDDKLAALQREIIADITPGNSSESAREKLESQIGAAK